MAKVYRIDEVSKITGIEGAVLIEFVRREWIHPVDDQDFDEEDLARVRLINDLVSSLGVNDDAVPIILHLIDQLHCLRRKIKSQDFNDLP